MIPLLLSLKNFMCYGSNVPELNLENIHVACLSGNNGHGKTAILDSITWVLWGKSRTRTQDELVHQGQRSMTVEMEFSSQSQRYRVTRTLSISNSGSSKTELNLSVINDGNAVSIMGDTIRDTEQKIIDLIHMDYDTFISTSYLKQGNSDHFTKSRPSERKKILAEVLDLAYYEKLEQLSKEKSRELKSEISKNEAIYAKDLETIQNKSALEITISKCTFEIDEISSTEKTLEEKSYKIRSEIGSLQQLNKEILELKSRLRDSSKQISNINTQINEWESEIRSLLELTSRKREITKNKIDHEKSTLKLKSSTESKNKIQALKIRKIELDSKVTLEHHNIVKELERLKTRKAELDGSQTTVKNIQQHINEQKTKLSATLEILNSLNNKDPELESIASRIELITQENTLLKNIMEETKNFHDLLKGHDSNCPLCMQTLNSTDQESLRFQYENKGKESRRKFDQNIKKLFELKKTYESKKNKIATKITSLSDLKSKYEKDIAVHETTFIQHEKLCKELEQINPKIENINSILSNKLYAENEQLESKHLHEAISNIEFDEKAHIELETKIVSLTPFLQLHGQLEQAEQRILSLESITESQKSVLETTQKTITQSKKRINRISKQTETIPTLESKWTILSKNIDSVRTELQGLVSKREHARYELSKINMLEPKVIALGSKLSQQKEELVIFDELSAAFGKNGVQALIIERIVPQIEDNANELLSKLTDNRMTLELNLKEGRIDRLTGLPSEELVINISDDSGTRSYESFSGGETFRIDFALRISLSKLLASRSGAPLPILFIDEGFGSQDTEGQERLTDAIQSIQNQFEKIIVITHIDRMKENFEERIEVVKEPSGSTFSLV